MLLNHMDIVNVYLTHSKKHYEVKLIEVRERFGSDHGYKTKPLCKGIITKIIDTGTKFSTPELNVKIGDETLFDYSYITHVVSRSGLVGFRKINIFQRHMKYDYAFKHNKNILYAPLKELCHTYLGRLKEQIITEIDFEKLKLRRKSLTGILRHTDGLNRNFTYVKKSHFECWFKKNWRHILRSKKLAHKLVTEENDRYNQQYEEDYFKDYEREQTKRMFLDEF